MYVYAEIDANGIPFSKLQTPVEVKKDTMIPVKADFDWTNKKYENDKWIEVDEKVELELTPAEQQEARETYIMAML